MKTTKAPTPRTPAAVPTFYVLRFKGYPVTAHLVVERLFATRLQAEVYLSQRTPHAWKYVVDYATWRERERIMIYAGIHKPLPFAKEPFFADAPADHFPHVCLRDPALMSYTESPEKGELDRQQPIKVGRYLKTFFPHLTERQLTYYSEWFAQGNKPDPLSHVQMAFATTPDEIVDVYARGPYSCMQDKNAPAPYGAGDLTVAYLSDPTGGDRVMGRALCWPEQMVFGRVYPTPHEYQRDSCFFNSLGESQSYYDSLFNRLRAMGWTHISERGDIFDGARLLKMPLNDEQTAWTFPYLDNAYKFQDGGTHWILNHREGNSASAYGGIVAIRDGHTYDTTVRGPPVYDDDDDGDDEYDYYCESCGNGLNSCQTTTVYTDFSQANGEDWCESCRSEHAFFCDFTDEYYSSNNNPHVVFPNGNVWHVEAAQEDAFQCPVTGEWCENDEGYSVQVSEDDCDTVLWCIDAINTAAFVCGWNEVNYPLTSESVRFPGFAVWDDENEDITPETRAEHGRQLEQAA